MLTEKPRWSVTKQLEDTFAHGAAQPILRSPWGDRKEARKENTQVLETKKKAQ